MVTRAHDAGCGNQVPSGYNRSNSKRCTCTHYVTFVDLNFSGYIRSSVIHTWVDITAFILRGPNGRTTGYNRSLPRFQPHGQEGDRRKEHRVITAQASLLSCTNALLYVGGKDRRLG